MNCNDYIQMEICIIYFFISLGSIAIVSIIKFKSTLFEILCYIIDVILFIYSWIYESGQFLKLSFIHPYSTILGVKILFFALFLLANMCLYQVIKHILNNFINYNYKNIKIITKHDNELNIYVNKILNNDLKMSQGMDKIIKDLVENFQIIVNKDANHMEIIIRCLQSLYKLLLLNTIDCKFISTNCNNTKEYKLQSILSKLLSDVIEFKNSLMYNKSYDFVAALNNIDNLNKLYDEEICDE